MTHSNPATGHHSISCRPRAGLRLLCGVLLCVAALPVFAQQAAAVARPAADMQEVAGEQAPATAATARATTAATTAATGDALPMTGRALLLAGDLQRLAATAPTTATTAKPEAASGNRIQNVLKRALALLGTPYRWGGTTTSGFDCSGLVGYVFRTTLGIELPRVSRDMAHSGEPVANRADLSPGDLVFFGRRGRVSHVGIYVGDGQFVHAPRTGKEVEVSSLDNSYWSHKYLRARRVAGI